VCQLVRQCRHACDFIARLVEYFRRMSEPETYRSPRKCFLDTWRQIMKSLWTLIIGVGAVMSVGMPADAAELKVGDNAPEFEMKGSDGKTYKLSQFKDKQAVVVAWYPKAFTGG
jgi:hypothetical protein